MDWSEVLTDGGNISVRTYMMISLTAQGYISYPYKVPAGVILQCFCCGPVRIQLNTDIREEPTSDE
ncbi:hypothetical protein PHLCEN_2v11473 [Hermanssonia centrifuga]|uniref:Uncharacterized protein n=1 Tax=Hermanssonia centrifuga TaxID=98765 RepID=A0A2R6NJW4_9APHY|nr:hypothetical protein PHLCEN_2v11473 [Hermanssonia centrifuga]